MWVTFGRLLTSTTDPEARLCKKSRGSEAELCYLGHVKMENRNGLGVNSRLTQAPWHGRAERGAGDGGRDRGLGARNSGADKGYDRQEFAARAARSQRYPANRTEAAQCDRPADQPPWRLCYQSDPAQAGSKRSSAGSRPWAACARLAIAESSGWAGCSPWHWPPATWCECAIFCPHQHRATSMVGVMLPHHKRPCGQTGIND